MSSSSLCALVLVPAHTLTHALPLPHTHSWKPPVCFLGTPVEVFVGNFSRRHLCLEQHVPGARRSRINERIDERKCHERIDERIASAALMNANAKKSVTCANGLRTSVRSRDAGHVGRCRCHNLENHCKRHLRPSVCNSRLRSAHADPSFRKTPNCIPAYGNDFLSKFLVTSCMLEKVVKQCQQVVGVTPTTYCSDWLRACLPFWQFGTESLGEGPSPV